MATYYWVGGTGTWNSSTKTNWSLTTGGVGGLVGPPTSSDTAIIDGNSGTGTITCTSASATCLNLTVTASQAITLAGTLSLLYGSLSYPSGGSFASSVALTFVSTSTGNTITTNGKTLSGAVTFNGSGGSWLLNGSLTCSSTVTLTAGTIDLTNNGANNGYTLTCNVFSSSNSNTRSILFGTGNITITGNAATVFNMGTATNFSYTGTPTVNLTYSGSTGTRTINANSSWTESQVVNLYIKSGSDIVTVGSVGLSAGNLDFTGFSGTFNRPTAGYIYRNFTLGSGMTLTAVSNTLNFVGTVASTQTITTNSVTVNCPLVFQGTAKYSINGALTQSSSYSTTFSSGNLQFTANTTNTFGTFSTSGTTVKYLSSSTPGTQATISQASGTVNATYLTIQDSAATGGATWYALFTNNNVSSGDNSGWIFATPNLSTSTTSTSTIGFQYTFAKLLSYLSTSVATITNIPNKLLSVTSTSVVSIQRFISKIFSTISEMSVVVLTESAFHLVLLAITESNAASIIKSISKTFSVSSTSSSSMSVIKSFLKSLSSSTTSTVTMVTKYAVGKVISLSVSSTASLVKTAQKYFTVISTSTTTLIRSISVTFTVISATIATLLSAVFPKLGAVIRYTFTADMRDNLIQLFKQRNVRANESNNKVQK